MNYYGDGCTTFCRARDDQFGHYNCSSTGQKVCLDGWEGSECDIAKCRSGCNQLHGYCEKPNTCECRPGWTGSRCDECLTYPGCQNGYCLSSWQCICQKNWGGVLCDQDLNYCGSHDPCKNNGTCQNTAPGKYKCHCTKGFTGVDCGLPDVETFTQLSSLGCPSSICLNGGTCVGYEDVFDQSETQEKDSIHNNSQNVSIVYDSDSVIERNSTNNSSDNRNLYRCHCAPGWSGEYCQWPIVSSQSTNFELDYVAPTTTGIYIETDQILSSNDQQNTNDINQTTVSTTESKYITYIENGQQVVSQHVEMRHLISWVVIATFVGVFLACLLIVWCCIIAIENNKFSFIQMNIIRSGYCDSQPQEPFSSRLRRVHEKIRDSFRRTSTNSIKPNTKLSIENVLKPPPSYEESSNYCLNKIQLERYIMNDTKLSDKSVLNSTSDILVNREEDLLQKPPIIISVDAISTNTNIIDSTNINCPRHGYLYRQKQQLQNKNDHSHQICTGQESTYITIEGKNSKRSTHH